MEWFRWYSGTVSDPKWQLVAADSGQPVAFVLAVWAHVLERANAGNGTMDGWNSRVVAVSIGATSEAVNAIIDAMQGLVLDGDAVSKWSERQPKRREDDSAERVRAHRAKKRDGNAVTDDVTQCNAPQRAETLEESRVEEIRDNVIHQHCDSHLTAPQKIAGATQEGTDDDGRSKRGSRLKADWCPSVDDLAFASSIGLDASGEADKFRDYWLAQPGQKGIKLDWTATWRNWCRRSAERPPGGKKPQGGGGSASSVMEALRWNLNQPQREIDVFGRRIRNGLDDGEGCCPGPAGKSPRP